MIKMMEYMTLSKPIVAFDLTEHRATAADAALYAAHNDERDFARQIARLIDDARLRDSMGAKGRRRIEKQLAWKFQVDNLLDAYEKMGQAVCRNEISVTQPNSSLIASQR